MSDRLGQWTCHICARKVAAGVMCVHGPHTKHQPTLPPAEAPPETSHAAAVPVSPDRLQWVLDHNMQIRAGHRVQIANAVEAWRRDRADVARLTAERDTARAQVWAEAIRVVEQMPDAAFESGHARSLWTFTNMLKRADVLAALRAAQKGRTE